MLTKENKEVPKEVEKVLKSFGPTIFSVTCPPLSED